MDALRRFNNDETATQTQKDRRLRCLQAISRFDEGHDPADGTCHFCGTTEDMYTDCLLCPDCDAEMEDLS